MERARADLMLGGWHEQRIRALLREEPNRLRAKTSPSDVLLALVAQIWLLR